MQKILLLFILLVTSTISGFAQCEEEDDPKILLIGDSWAFFMYSDGTFDNVLNHWGHSNYHYVSNPTLSVSGARTEDFLVESRLDEMQNQLNDNPDIEIVHISLGGNDFLGEWNVDFTEEETQELSDETYDELIAVIDFLKGVREDIHIVFSGYMYANFEEVINDAAPFEESHPFYGNWEEMGFPNFEELNSLLNDFSDRMYELSLEDDQIDFIHAPGYMQYVYGQEEPLGVEPGGTYAPFTQPLPYGDITYPSPKESMRDYGITRDCFHLSADGYFYMIDYQFQKLYHKLLMDDAYILAEADANNGSITGGTEVYSDLRLGEPGTEETQMLLSFDMGDIPDTVFTGADIFLRRDSLSGENPIGAYVELTMINGYFGASEAVEIDDFSSAGDITELACVHGMNEENSNWLRIELPETFLPLINNDSQMQFLMRITTSDVDELFFSDGSDPDFAPVFNLEYKSDFAGVEEIEKEKELIIFPNPAQNQLNVFNADITEFNQYQIIDIKGQVVINENQFESQIDISSLTPGTYFIRLIGQNEVLVQQFIKK